MRSYLLYILALVCFSQAHGQKALEQIIDKYNDESVPYVTVNELMTWEDFVLLDTREKTEFDISHIKNSIYVGYSSFDLQTVLRHYPDKNRTMVVYCSVGIRSEDIGEQLILAGYTDVYNLYGGIFKWYERGQPVYDAANNRVKKIHGYLPRYGKWLTKGLKVYD